MISVTETMLSLLSLFSFLLSLFNLLSWLYMFGYDHTYDQFSPPEWERKWPDTRLKYTGSLGATWWQTGRPLPTSEVHESEINLTALATKMLGFIWARKEGQKPQCAVWTGLRSGTPSPLLHLTRHRPDVLWRRLTRMWVWKWALLGANPLVEIYSLNTTDVCKDWPGEDGHCSIAFGRKRKGGRKGGRHICPSGWVSHDMTIK